MAASAGGAQVPRKKSGLGRTQVHLASNGLHGFVEVRTWICRSNYSMFITCISHRMPPKTKLKFDQNSKLSNCTISAESCCFFGLLDIVCHSHNQ